MARCKKCGAEVLEGALFCTECGEALTQPFESGNSGNMGGGFAAAGASMSNYGKPQYNKEEGPAWGRPEEPYQEEPSWGIPEEPYQQPYQDQPYQQPYYGGGYEQYDDYIDGPIRNDKLWSIMSYFSLLFWCIAYFASGTGGFRSNFLKYHLNRSLVLGVAGIIAGMIDGMMERLGDMLWLVLFVYTVYGIVMAIKGIKKSLPPLEKFNLLK